MSEAALKQDTGQQTLDDDELLRVVNLKKYFPVGKTFFAKNRRQVKAVDDVSFSVKKGEVVGLVGESGSGKTTIGRMIMRLIDPTSGSIQFGETDVATAEGKQLMAMRKAIQIIFQDPYGSLNPRMKVGPIIREGLDVHRMYSMAERNERIARLLETVGLGPAHVNRHPHEFSGGQRQRIGIARALAVSPQLLVADEPVSALDVSVQAQVLNLLQDLKEEYEFSMLMISHDLGVVEHACDKVIVLYLGRVMEMAPAEKLYADPVHPYTQSLLSAMPVPDPRRRHDQNRIILKGDIPSPINPPSGCVFRTRCPIATDECARVVPPLEETSPGHFKACIHR
ncbi:ABC transporter ATP-binding protein [Halomonas sp. ML-15]|uniref:ABC transporter ATP-binding protein n=1 Tax=Halomonas sp. ML-15 TaxID=2773305 RepID=UPI00174650AA|nr:ABC transporter ATP-binding protein [Halomonas sp. ML-15]MBD3895716.1 ABC transporter ATP-binding protein [Halomonas sp. ML-15]